MEAIFLLTDTDINSLPLKIISMIDNNVFQGKLSGSYKFTWSRKLTSTAGKCKPIIHNGKKCGIIKLSSHLCNTFQRILETIAHEICHLAAWIFDNYKGHGKIWKTYVLRVSKRFPELSSISRCHTYRKIANN